MHGVSFFKSSFFFKELVKSNLLIVFEKQSVLQLLTPKYATNTTALGM